MTDRDDILKALTGLKIELMREYSIRRVGLFGSYSKGTHSAASDIDLVYELEEGKRLGLAELYNLENFLKTKLQNNKLDLVNVDYINPVVEAEISNSIIYV